jgi:hypothetical protein
MNIFITLYDGRHLVPELVEEEVVNQNSDGDRPQRNSIDVEYGRELLETKQE